MYITVKDLKPENIIITIMCVESEFCSRTSPGNYKQNDKYRELQRLAVMVLEKSMRMESEVVEGIQGGVVVRVIRFRWNQLKGQLERHRWELGGKVVGCDNE